MRVLELYRSLDFHCCDLCGDTFAYGYELTFDRADVSSVHPHACCYDGVSVDDDEVARVLYDFAFASFGGLPSFESFSQVSLGQFVLELRAYLPRDVSLVYNEACFDPYDYGCDFDDF